MGKTLEQVKEFHELFDHRIGEKPEAVPVEVARLRFNLIFEELMEFAEAADIEMSAYLAIQKKLNEMGQSKKTRDSIDEGVNVDLVGVLDAFADIRYVVNGSIISYGMQDVFHDAFNEVHNSNMSKACETEKELQQTLGYYKGSGVEAKKVVKKIGDTEIFLVKRVSDNKQLKSVDYKPADLAQFIVIKEDVQVNRESNGEQEEEANE